MLSDPACLGNLPQNAQESLFDPEYWRRRGELEEVSGGRGSAWFIASGARQWVLRHFRRGGFIARLWQDSYLWAGENRVRAFAEWRILQLLTQRGLPVPKPVAARYQRSGLVYRCDLITQRILNAEPLSALLARGALGAGAGGEVAAEAAAEARWRAVGAAIAILHRAGADHADLNAHNILMDTKGAVSIIDFDRGRLRGPGAWAAQNLRRLKRSLVKIGHFSEESWSWLMAGYGAQ
jgi:3-deoxy-D-manno-octulosonic acid kinase